MKFKINDVVKVKCVLYGNGKKMGETDMIALIGKIGIILPDGGSEHFKYTVKFINTYKNSDKINFNTPELIKVSKKESKLFKQTLVEDEI